MENHPIDDKDHFGTIRCTLCVKGIDHEDCIQKPVKQRKNNLQKDGKCTDCDFRSKHGGAIKKHFNNSVYFQLSDGGIIKTNTIIHL